MLIVVLNDRENILGGFLEECFENKSSYVKRISTNSFIYSLTHKSKLRVPNQHMSSSETSLFSFDGYMNILSDSN